MLNDMLEKDVHEIKINVESINESGNNALINARIKAEAYYKAINMPVFSCDSGLYIDGLYSNEQPGVHVRRVNGKVLNDEEMIEYYTKLALRQGGEVRASKVIRKMMKAEKRWLIYSITAVIVILIIVFESISFMNNTDSVSQHIQRNEVAPVPWFIAFMPTILLPFLIIGFIFLMKYFRNIQKRHYESNKLVQEEMQFTFDDQGIECRTERSLLKMNWDEVYKIYISRNYFVIFVSDRTVWVTSKQHFDSSAASDLVNIFKVKINKKKIRTAKY